MKKIKTVYILLITVITQAKLKRLKFTKMGMAMQMRKMQKINTWKVRKLCWNSIVVIIQKNFSGNIFFAWRYLRQIKIKYIACCHRFHNMTCCKGKTTNFIFVT